MSLVATTVAVARLGESGPLVHFAFFLLSGLLWILPAMGIIKWMMVERKPKKADSPVRPTPSPASCRDLRAAW